MNEEEFELRMAEVDAKLRRQGLPVGQRSHQAFDVLAPNCSFTFLPSWQREMFPKNEYKGQDLYEKIQDWYMRHYGERSQWMMGLQTIPVILLDDVYFLRMPLRLNNEPHKINVLEMVEGFTPLTASLLTKEETAVVVTMFEEGYELSLELENLFGCLQHASSSSRISKDPFLIRADRDREIAVRSLTIPYDCNNSIFHSQQFAEKMLKSLLYTIESLEEETIRKDYNHGIRDIWKRVNAKHQGHETISNSVAVISQISMSVRYSLDERSIEEAVMFFWEALRIAAHCAKSLQDVITPGRFA